MGFYAPAQLLKDAQRHGVKVLPVDVNESFYDCTLEFDRKNWGQSKNSDKWGQSKNSFDSGENQQSSSRKFYSDPNFSPNFPPKLRIGFTLVKGMSEPGANAVVEARQTGAFINMQDLVFRSGINKKDLEALAAADALRALSGDRHRAFWQASGVETGGKENWGPNKENLGQENWGQSKNSFKSGGGNRDGDRKFYSDPNFPDLNFSDPDFSGNFPSDPLSPTMSFYADPKFADSDFGVDVLLPVASESQNIVGDYGATGFTLRRHPLALFRQHLDKYQVSTASDLADIENEANVKVTGLVTCRQRPMTAAGVTFLTLEDESGFVNVVVWPSLGEKLRPIVRQAMLIGVVGHVQKSDGVIHLIASHLVDLSHWLGSMELSSRNFT